MANPYLGAILILLVGIVGRAMAKAKAMAKAEAKFIRRTRY